MRSRIESNTFTEPFSKPLIWHGGGFIRTWWQLGPQLGGVTIRLTVKTSSASRDDTRCLIIHPGRFLQFRQFLNLTYRDEVGGQFPYEKTTIWGELSQKNCTDSFILRKYTSWTCYIKGANKSKWHALLHMFVGNAAMWCDCCMLLRRSLWLAMLVCITSVIL